MAQTKRPSDRSDQDPVVFLSELLERLVEAQLVQSEKMANLYTREEITSTDIKWIKSQFTNGFRSEIKKHLTDAMDEHNKCAHEKLEILTKEIIAIHSKIRMYSRPKFWAKIGLAVLVSMISVSFAVHSAYSIWKERSVQVEEIRKESPNHKETGEIKNGQNKNLGTR